jgi:hypothetical protein
MRREHEDLVSHRHIDDDLYVIGATNHEDKIRNQSKSEISRASSYTKSGRRKTQKAPKYVSPFVLKAEAAAKSRSRDALKKLKQMRQQPLPGSTVPKVEAWVEDTHAPKFFDPTLKKVEIFKIEPRVPLHRSGEGREKTVLKSQQGPEDVTSDSFDRLTVLNKEVLHIYSSTASWRNVTWKTHSFGLLVTVLFVEQSSRVTTGTKSLLAALPRAAWSRSNKCSSRSVFVGVHPGVSDSSTPFK